MSRMHYPHARPVLLAMLLTVLSWTATRSTQAQQPTLPKAWVDVLSWRSIGPATMGGRITALAFAKDDPSTWWAATASGGLLKTTSNGTAFEHQFDRESTISIGDVQVAPSDPNIVWVGTGESNPRNSVSWGDGVYKSTDGGKTWKNMGLKKTFQIGRIAIHPKNPDIVYVGALGRLWGPNPERGLFKTTDGGKTWNKILFVDDKTGVIDVQMSPGNPDVLLVATYERQRDGFDGNDPAKKFGPGSGLYRTDDGGKSFTKITEGLPSGNLGRIGISFYQKNPKHVYIVLESEQIGKLREDFPYAGIQGTDAEVGAKITNVTKNGAADKAGLKVGDIVIGVDDQPVYSYADLTKAIRRGKAGQEVVWKVVRDHKGIELKVKYDKHRQAGKREGSPFSTRLGGQPANVHEDQGDQGHEYGGIYHSEDGGVTWKRINSLNPRPMYFSQIRVDPQDNNHIWVLGIPLFHSADGGKTFEDNGAGGGVHVDHHALWIDPRDGRHMVLGNDGGIYVTYDRGAHWDHHNHAVFSQFYHVGVGPRRRYRVYGGLQDNGSWGAPNVVRHANGPTNPDWFRVGGGDGFVCIVDPENPDLVYAESQNGAMMRRNLKTGESGFLRPRPPRGVQYRFNWKTPFILSHHNSGIHYSAGNYVFRSLNRGSSIKAISPEISLTDKGAGSAIDESPRNADVLYVGTTDGALWSTRDGGHTWNRLYPPPEKSDTKQKSQADKEKSTDKEQTQRPGAPSEQLTDTEFIAMLQPPAGQPPRRRRFNPDALKNLFRQQDADGDGKLQKSEWPERLTQLFQRADADHDDVLTAAELDALIARFSRQPAGAARPNQPPAGQPPQDKPTPQEAQTKNKPASDDPLSGKWEGQFFSENLPESRRGFELIVRRKPDGTYGGSLNAAMGDGTITEGSFDAAKGEVTLVASVRGSNFTLSGKLVEGQIDGQATIERAGVTIDFSAKRTGDAPEEGAAEEEPKTPKTPGGKPLQELLPGPRWVSSITASRFSESRVYVTFDGHRSNDDRPYPMISEDYGQTWRSLKSNLPDNAGSTRVLREDIVNQDVLYLGCEFGCWVSIDRGKSWTRLNSNMPHVAVHEFAQHATSGELIAATHGRGIWIADVTTIRQLKPESIKVDAALFRPNSVVLWEREPSRGDSGGPRAFVGQNPPRVATIDYSFGKSATSAELVVLDWRGNTVAKLDVDTKPGLHRATWDLRAASGQRGRRGRAPTVPPGNYLVRLTANGKSIEQPLVIEADPGD